MYALKYQIGPYAYDSGLSERLLIERWRWTGPVTELQGAGPDWFVLRMGRQGSYDLTDPIPPAEARIRVIGRFGSRLAEIQGSEDGAYRVRWQTEIGGVWRTRWVGYLAQQEYYDYPYEPAAAVEVRAVDGLGLLQHVLWDHAIGEAFPASLHRVLEGIVHHLRRAGPPGTADGLLGGLVTRMDWRPFVEGVRIANGRDPLTVLLHKTAAFTSEDGKRVTALEHVRELAERFGCQLIQSRLEGEDEPRWVLRQRNAWRPDAQGEVLAWGYDAGTVNTDPIGSGGAYDMGGASIDVPSVFTAGAPGTDAPWLMTEPGLQRGVTHRVREVVSTYDYEPDLDQLVTNGSFEEEGATEEEAAGWTLTEHHDAKVLRWPLENLFPDDFDDANAHGLVIELPSGQTPPFSRAEQQTGVYLPGLVGEGAIRLSYAAAYRRQPPTGPHVSAGLIGGVEIIVEGGDTTWYAAFAEIRCRTATTAGNRVTVYVDPIAGDIPEAVEGVVAIPAGTTLHFRPGGTYKATLTLRKAARVGDTVLVGDLTHNLEPDHTAQWWRWTETPSGTRGTAPIDTDQTLALNAYALALALNDLEGRAVHGHVTLAFIGGNGQPLPEWAIYDGVELSVEYGGSVASEIAYQSALPTSKAGISLRLPRSGGFALGDGPSPESHTALYAIDPATGAVHPTIQQGGPGWKEGIYDAEEPSSGLSIDALHARTVLLAQAEPLERRRIAMVMQAGAVYEPHQLVRLIQAQRLARSCVASDVIETDVALRVGDVVTIGEETRTVTEVSGAGPMSAKLDSALTGVYPAGTVVTYARDYAPDYVEQVPGRSLVIVEGTELYESAITPIEQVLQQ